MEHILDVDALDVQLALPVGVVVRRAVEADRDERRLEKVEAARVAAHNQVSAAVGVAVVDGSRIATGDLLRLLAAHVQLLQPAGVHLAQWRDPWWRWGGR